MPYLHKIRHRCEGVASFTVLDMTMMKTEEYYTEKLHFWQSFRIHLLQTVCVYIYIINIYNKYINRLSDRMQM